MTIALEFEHVSKRFRGTTMPELRERIRASRDRLMRRTVRSSEVVAIDDASFQIEQGDSVALMGLNGSGKTTALKIISRVMYPTEGLVRVRGRVGALIEVGSGLHPELTGRENIDLYGRILGLSRQQIAERFDAIVDFADVPAALDMPVKFYSSGMQLRLGFSVAAHVNPDVLLVDEAVSVGDAGFQQRCLDLMNSLVEDAGTTVVFVSHLPFQVGRVCDKGIFLREGRVAQIGSADDVIATYVQESTERASRASGDAPAVRVLGWDVKGIDEPGPVELRFELDVTQELDDPRFGFSIMDAQQGNLITASMVIDDYEMGTVSPGRLTVRCELEAVPLRPGSYLLGFTAQRADGWAKPYIRPVILGHMAVGSDRRTAVVRSRYAYGPIDIAHTWKLDR